MCKVITIANQKGGVAKTTTTQVLGTALAELDKQVLLIDLDPQWTLTNFSGLEPEDEKTIYSLFKNEMSVKDVICHTKYGYDLIPGSLELSGADMEFAMLHREFILKGIIDEIKNEYQYDYILIDTPPSLGILNINAMIAADEVIVTITADKAGLQGFGQLYQTITSVKFYNHNLKINGILINKFQANQNVQKKYKEELEIIADKLNLRLYLRPIRLAAAVLNGQDDQKNIFLMKNQNVVKDYKDFVSEFLRSEEE